MDKFTLFILICLALLNNSLAIKKRIAGGKYVNVRDFSYQATLIHHSVGSATNGEPICGATIITNKWLVTAGHCLQDMTTTELKVRTGATKRYNDGEEHDIERMIIHPGLQVHDYIITDDIALIQLAHPVVFNDKQKPIPLAKSSDNPTLGKILTISGFGREERYEEDQKILHLKAAYLPVVSLAKWKDNYFLDPVTDKMLCAGNSTDGSCNGDSGGPGIMDGRLAAIISSGFICDTTNVPAVFTAVYKYLDWISKYIR